MKRVYTAPNSLMVDHLKLVLDSAGIDSVVEHRFLSGATGQIPANETWPELWILDDSQEARAREIITSAAVGEPAGRRTCLACGQQVGQQFDSCWNCGAPAGSLVRPAGFERQGEPPSWSRPRSGVAVHWAIWAAAACAAVVMLHAYTK